MPYWIYKIGVYIEVYWHKVLQYFGKEYDTKIIPEGPYCYVPDIEKNKNKPKDDYSYYTKTCKYYRWLEGLNGGCTFTGEVGDDFLLGDQCKICGENNDYIDKF